MHTVACQQAGRAASPGGPVSFVDAAGNRMLVDMPSATPVVAQPILPDAEIPGSASVQAAPDDLSLEAYPDSEQLSRERRALDNKRFYALPDGTGGRQVVTSEVLNAMAPSEDEPGDRGPDTELLPCGKAPAMPYLLAVDEAAVQHSLVFPVLDPSFSKRRYAGYSVPIPPAASTARILTILKNGLRADVVVFTADSTGVPIAVVNNIATETIPETLFRYAMVATNVPLSVGAAGQRLAVVEGTWARKLLPATCRPPAPESGSAVSGKVSVEFTLKGLEQ